MDETRKPVRKPIGYVVANVRFPLYEGDHHDSRSWKDFVYEEPGITKDGGLGVCRRDCETITAVVMLKDA